MNNIRVGDHLCYFDRDGTKWPAMALVEHVLDREGKTDLVFFNRAGAHVALGVPIIRNEQEHRHSWAWLQTR